MINLNIEELKLLLKGLESIGANEVNWELQNKIIIEINKLEELRKTLVK